jgi:hypothetical protein
MVILTTLGILWIWIAQVTTSSLFDGCLRNFGLIPGRKKRYFSCPECPSWPPIWWAVGAYTPGGVKLQNEADHSHVVLMQEMF